MNRHYFKPWVRNTEHFPYFSRWRLFFATLLTCCILCRAPAFKLFVGFWFCWKILSSEWEHFHNFRISSSSPSVFVSMRSQQWCPLYVWHRRRMKAYVTYVHSGFGLRGNSTEKPVRPSVCLSDPRYRPISRNKQHVASLCNQYQMFLPFHSHLYGLWQHKAEPCGFYGGSLPEIEHI